MARKQELLRGHERLNCCSLSAVWHRIQSRTFKLGESVEVANSSEFFGRGIVTSNPGENCCGDVRHRFLVEVTYSDGSSYHCLPCQLLRSSEPPKHRPQATGKKSQGFSITAIGLDGQRQTLPRLTPEMQVAALRQQLAKQLEQPCWWLLKLLLAGSLLEDTQTLGEIGIEDASASITYVLQQRRKRDWQLLMAHLLQALRGKDDQTAKGIVQGVLKANRKYHLTHVVRNVCLAGDMPMLETLAAQVPVEVLCQALLIKRGSVYDRYKNCRAPVIFTLWEFHYDSFKLICLRLFEAGRLSTLSEKLPQKMFADVWSGIDGHTLAWMDPLKMQTHEELMKALEDPAKQPKRWKSQNPEFLAALQEAGITFRDLAAMEAQIRSPYEWLTATDCARLPEQFRLLFLKWTTNFFGSVCRRPKNLEAFANMDRVNSFLLQCYIEKAGLEIMATCVPGGMALLYAPPGEKERLEALFVQHLSAQKMPACGAGLLLTASLGLDVKLWSSEDGSCVRSFGEKLGGPGAAISKDRASVFTAHVDGTVRLWSVVDGVCQRTFEHGKESLKVLTLSDDNSTLITACDGGRVKLWNLKDGACTQTFEHEDLTSVAFSHDCATLLTGSDDGSAKLWHVPDGSCVQVFAHSSSSEVNAVALSLNKPMVLTGGEDGNVKLWQEDDGSWLCKHTFDHYRQSLVSVSFSSDGELALTVAGVVGLWSTKDGTCAHTLIRNQGLASAQFIANDNLILTGDSGGRASQSVALWSVATGCCMRSFSVGDPEDDGSNGEACVVAFCETTATVLAGINRGSAKLWCPELNSSTVSLVHDRTAEEGSMKLVGFVEA